MKYVEIPLKNLLHVSKVTTILYLGFAPGYRSGLDVHNFWELIYVDRGITRVCAGEKEFPLKCGEVILHRPNLPHRIICDGTQGANVFIISFNCKSAAMKRFGGSPITLPPPLRPLITSIIEEGTKVFNCSALPMTLLPDAPLGGQQMIRILLETLLIQLLRSLTVPANVEIPDRPKQSDNSLVDRIMSYLDQHIYDRVTIGQLCEEFHYGKSRLCALFREATGKTIITYFTEKKIEAARELMRQGKTIRETAALLGFDTPQYFSRIFKIYTGMSPRDYRNSLLFSVNSKVKRRQLNAGTKRIQEI
ncbi:MAG: AraC family transcriptional regulator [Clostridiales bacterium]|jgi:AraC-like DNA-binding protein|nr:AraC family transcriptional regulator [Clostridiales bacterium]